MLITSFSLQQRTEPIAQVAVNGRARCTPAISCWSLRKSSTLITICASRDALRWPTYWSLAKDRSRYGFKTAGWGIKRTWNWTKPSRPRLLVYIFLCPCKSTLVVHLNHLQGITWTPLLLAMLGMMPAVWARFLEIPRVIGLTRKRTDLKMTDTLKG